MGREMGEGPRGRGHMYTYDWFMLMFDRKQQSSVKQLSFKLKIIFLKNESISCNIMWKIKYDKIHYKLKKKKKKKFWVTLKKKKKE